METQRVDVDDTFVYKELYDTAIDFYLMLSDYEDKTENNWNCLLSGLADLLDELDATAKAITE